MVVRLHLLAHVVVLVLERDLHGLCAVAAVDEVRAAQHFVLLLLEERAVVIPYYIGEGAFLHRALAAYDVDEPFVAFRVFRPLLHGQQGVEFLGDEQ